MKRASIIFLLSSVTLLATAQTETAKQKTISVTGTAEAEITPDIIYVQVDLREYDKKGFGKIELDSIKRNFIAACKNVGLNDSDITVEAYDGNSSYWALKKSRQKNPDLKASISYWVKVASTQKMDELVDKLDDEATQNFFIAKTDYSKRIELKKQLKTNAIRAAKDKAVYLTDAIGEHVNGAITINDLDGIDDNTYYLGNMAASQANTSNSIDTDDGKGISFKKIKFQFKVSVVFALQ